MISLLARIGSRQAIGIHLAGSEAHARHVASTPFGCVELARQSDKLDLQKPHEAIKRLVIGLSQGRPGKLPVVIGLPVEQMFFTTRPMQVGGGEASSRVLLREALFSATAPVEEMVVDVVKSQSGNRKLASIVSCEQNLVERLMGPLKEMGVQRVHMEPSPCALVAQNIGGPF